MQLGTGQRRAQPAVGGAAIVFALGLLTIVLSGGTLPPPDIDARLPLEPSFEAGLEVRAAAAHGFARRRPAAPTDAALAATRFAGEHRIADFPQPRRVPPPVPGHGPVGEGDPVPLPSDAHGAPAATPSAIAPDEDRSAIPPTSAGQPDPVSTAAGPMAFGAYVHGAPWSDAPRREFEAMLGRPLAIVMWYQTWGSGGASLFDPAMMERAAAGGAMPMLTWVPEASSAFSLDRVIAGQYDDYLRTFAQAAAAWGRPFLLRPMHEMNGDWHVWSAGINGNTATDYVAAWRHLHDMFRSVGASNVQWVWSPNTFVARTGTTYASLYPGDAYVDWVALDGYNNGQAQPWSDWTTFTEEFAASYDTLTALSPKPFMVAEVASCEAGGDKAEWIRSAFLDEIPQRFPAVRAVVWFQQNKECDWRVNSSADSLAAARTALTQVLWSGRVD